MIHYWIVIDRTLSDISWLARHHPTTCRHNYQSNQHHFFSQYITSRTLAIPETTCRSCWKELDCRFNINRMFSPRYNTRQVIICYLGSKFQKNCKSFHQIIIHMSVVKVTDLFACTEKTSLDSSQGPCYIAIFISLNFCLSVDKCQHQDADLCTTENRRLDISKYDH